jgi:hypothetical protein
MGASSRTEAKQSTEGKANNYHGSNNKAAITKR